jgi:predicted dehydrogenase
MLHGLLIGCGYFGQVQLDGWQRVHGGQIVALCDTDEARLRQAGERFGITALYADHREALQRGELDFADIATRPDTHLDLTAAAAERGLHVLCQKPLAMTWDESVAVVRAAAERGVRFMPNENWRWQPWYRELKRLLDGDRIGPPHSVWARRRAADAYMTPPFPRQPYFTDMERFLLIESVIHLVDAIRFLAGEYEWVSCSTRRVSGATKAEDSVALILGMRSGCQAVIDCNRCAEEEAEGPAWDMVCLEGPKGYLRLYPGGEIRHKPLFGPVRDHEYDRPKQGYAGDSCRATQQHFVDCLRTGRPFEQDGEQYLQGSVRAVFAAYESAETGCIVRLP